MYFLNICILFQESEMGILVVYVVRIAIRMNDANQHVLSDPPTIYGGCIYACWGRGKLEKALSFTDLRLESNRPIRSEYKYSPVNTFRTRNYC